MLEIIRTFFGKQRERGRVIVQEGELYRCTKCGLIFLNRVAGEKHECLERL